MKPAPFEYRVVQSVEEALELLGSQPGEARLLAGGQSLVPAMSARTETPALLIDINDVPTLRTITDHDDGIHLGALVRHAEVANNPDLAQNWPLLAEAVSHIASPAIRHRGTVGGSLAVGDPLAELATALTALDATASVASVGGQRNVPVADLSTAPFRTVLTAEEMIVAIQVPRHHGAVTAFHEISRRKGAAALGAAAVRLRLSAGTVADLRLALSGVLGSRLVDPTITDARLGLPASELASSSLVEDATASLEFVDDVTASSAYRRAVGVAALSRALDTALERADQLSNPA